MDAETTGRGANSAISAGARPPEDRYLRIDTTFCSQVDTDIARRTIARTGGCVDGELERGNTEPCPPGTVETGDLWVQRVQPDGTYGELEFVSAGQCVTPPNLAAEVERAFTSMTVPTPQATLQPERDVLLINVWHPVHASAEPVTQTATLLDVPVEIRAVPTEFTWDFDDPFSPDGGTLTTTDPGRPWTDGDPMPDEHWIGHAWTRLGDPNTRAGQTAGAAYDDDTGNKYRTDVTVTLTTTWRGQFRIAGTPTWTDIPGRLTTTSTTGTYTITEARSQLVCSDINGIGDC
ncbi:hypothetical protein Xcel_0781 [Xylanimonas cellulosilytica DSM 15894]|uniref:PKD domain-containing protein n=1 Tax=Xylanimonas cellulosilytica (strain DSM 15894 / JCM 12276 / CECT 5975 / KCTC 9989 / LMG 20990 / NBRC 107835 / XIL07) TaxID=446471 RepID=D1BXK9_XYLCX|nr:hypothetical protein [Xylanimonas cellulosilytica]ACZ29819.1 hypothetical protein Xcel_0781 [Xylanimonas cellulosilytica DSM 15894]